jgi:hypothetical protein
MSKTKTQVAIRPRALFQRIDRKLQQQKIPEKLCTARSEHQVKELGRYFTVVTGGKVGTPQAHGVSLVKVDLEKLGRKLGVLKPWERLGTEV